MNNYQFGDGLALGIFICVIAALVCVFSYQIGSDNTESRMREEAVNANAAEWVIDPHSGQRDFRYIGY
jgi:hypothetical protein